MCVCVGRGLGEGTSVCEMLFGCGRGGICDVFVCGRGVGGLGERTRVCGLLLGCGCGGICDVCVGGGVREGMHVCGLLIGGCRGGICDLCWLGVLGEGTIVCLLGMHRPHCNSNDFIRSVWQHLCVSTHAR